MLLSVIEWSHVWMVTLVGFCMVLLLLVVLIFVLKLFGALMQRQAQPKAAKPAAVEASAKPVADKAVAGDADEATKAAIAMALHLYYHGVHDMVAPGLTLRPKASPWNAKEYGMNNLHR